MKHARVQPDTASIVFTSDQPLIGILTEVDGRCVVRYSTEDPAIASSATAETKLHAALSVIGTWSELDWEEFSVDLDRIRHESQPTPPIEV